MFLLTKKLVMDDVLKSTSVLVSLPTLVYVGLAQRKNRVKLLQDLGGTMSPNLESYLTIPYEFLPVFISIVFGVALWFMRSNGCNGEGDKDDSGGTHIPTRRAVCIGAITGLSLSLAGRFGLDLPVNMFGFSPESAYMVHLVAPPLYMAIFIYV